MLLGLAVLSPLTMLPIYHRSYDVRLLLLAVPALAMVWAEGGLRRWVAFIFTAAGILGTGDVVLAALVWATDRMHLSSATLAEKLRFILWTRPVPLLMILIIGFYLVVYIRLIPRMSTLEVPAPVAQV